MATSGTATFNPEFSELVEEAYERAGLELRSGYDLRTARRSMNFMAQEWQNRGINLWTVESSTITLVPGQITYNLPADTIDIIEHQLRLNDGNTTSQADYTMSRISVSEYAHINNKNTQGMPLQIYVDRLRDNPVVYLWPVPDGSQTYTLAYWYLRRIQDAGNGINTEDIPFRMIPCMAAGLAYYLSLKIPDAMNRIEMLKASYEEQWALGSSEDREKASLRLAPRQYFY